MLKNRTSINDWCKCQGCSLQVGHYVLYFLPVALRPLMATEITWNVHSGRSFVCWVGFLYPVCFCAYIYLHITYYCFCLAVISLHHCFLLHYLFLGPEAWLNLISSVISRMLKTDLLGMRKKRKTTEVHAYSEGRLLWQMWMLCIGWDVGRWSTVATPKGNSW